MALFKKRMILGLGLIAAAILAGCATFPDAEKWSLPKKESAESGMIIGRIDRPNNKEENPTGEKLDLYRKSMGSDSFDQPSMGSDSFDPYKWLTPSTYSSPAYSSHGAG